MTEFSEGRAVRVDVRLNEDFCTTKVNFAARLKRALKVEGKQNDTAAVDAGGEKEGTLQGGMGESRAWGMAYIRPALSMVHKFYAGGQNEDSDDEEEDEDYEEEDEEEEEEDGEDEEEEEEAEEEGANENEEDVHGDGGDAEPGPEDAKTLEPEGQMHAGAPGTDAGVEEEQEEELDELELAVRGYDRSDPFIDDSELDRFYQSTSNKKRKGLFVHRSSRDTEPATNMKEAARLIAKAKAQKRSKQSAEESSRLQKRQKGRN